MRFREVNIKKAFEILDIKGSVPLDKVRKKYKELSKKWHPDLNDSKEANRNMQDINKAYETVMKEKFNIIDPWEDYQKWWIKQFNTDPIWGNPVIEKQRPYKKFAGLRDQCRKRLTSDRKENTKIKKFLDKKNKVAVIGVSKNPKKYGNKVYKTLKWLGYTVYPINPRLDSIDEEKCYASLDELPKKPDLVVMVVPPKVGIMVVNKAVDLGVKKVWLQPGAESSEIIKYCKTHKDHKTKDHKTKDHKTKDHKTKDHKVDIIHGYCIIIELRKFKENGAKKC